MPIEITMPRLSDTMERGTLLKWNVSEGDAVSAGDVVADIETDKATMELTVYDDGTMSRILVAEGETVDVGTPIALLAEEDAEAGAPDADSSTFQAPAEAAAMGYEGPSETPLDAETAVQLEAPRAGAVVARLRISPVARRLADEHHVDVSRISGTGPGGRIIKQDVLRAVETAGETQASRAPSAVPAPPAIESEPPPPPEPAPVVSAERVPVTQVPVVRDAQPLASRRVPLSGMRQTIAKRLVEATTTIPHYQVSMTFDMDSILELRRMLNEQLASTGVKLSVNDFIVRCCALAMHEHPEFNASWDGDGIVVHEDVNIGMAISVGPERGGGLVVGVIRHADQKSLRAISVESKHLAEKARTRGLSLEDMSGSTFTVSNLGMFGVEHFTAIINPPNSAILAIGGAIEKPVVRNGELTIGHEMSVTLSNDHRIIDGAMAARYLQTVKRYIENPATVMV